ncbi:exoribonuclease II [Pasteurella multocida]|nr:exoribonuclease II [Pasteurella multocida]
MRPGHPRFVKYSDMVNHRLIKAVLTQQTCEKPQDDLFVRLQEARRQNRLVERDIADWLYCRYLATQVEQKTNIPSGNSRCDARGITCATAC